MMSGQSGETLARPALVCSGFVGLVLLVALATDVALNELSLAKLAFMMGGFALLIPTMC